MLHSFNMRYTPFVAFLLAILSPAFSTAQQSGIEAALQKGNATELGVYFAKSVDLILPEDDETYSAADAITVLTDFFSKQTVKGYKRVHLNAPQEWRANYSIGDLYTVKGTYRTTIYLDTQQKITEIRIQK